MDWITTSITICTTELLARKIWQGWILGCLSQFIWFYMAWSNELYGLLPLPCYLLVRNCFALRRWRKEHEATRLGSQVPAPQS